MKITLWTLLTSLILAGCTSTVKEHPSKPLIQAPVKEEPEPVDIPVRPFPGDSFHQLLVAEFAVRRQDYQTALKNYLEQATKTRDKNVSARATRLAKFLKAEQATLDSARLWVELEPNNLEAHFTLAAQFSKLQKPLLALPHMKVVLNGNGNVNYVMIAAASAKLSKPEQQQVASHIDELLLEHPTNDQLLTAKAMLLQQGGNFEQALPIIQSALQVNKDNYHAIMVEARILQQLDRKDEAFIRIEQSLQDKPDNRRLRLQYARMLITHDIDKAKTQFEKLLQNSPDDEDLLLTLALIYKETGDLEASQELFSQLLNSKRYSPQAHINLGQMAEQNEQWETALSHYQQVAYGKLFLAAVKRIALIYQQQGELVKARTYLASLQQEYPDLALRLTVLESELLMATEYYQAGYDLLSEALLSFPNNDTLLYARSLFSDKLRNIDTLEQDLRAMLKNNPDNALALNALGYSLTNLSTRYEEAKQLISKALTLKPNDPAIKDSLGWAEYRLGNLDKALTLLQEAYSSFPDHEVAAHLGEVLWKLGRTQEAKKIWTEALKNKPDSPVIKETMQRLVGSTEE